MSGGGFGGPEELDELELDEDVLEDVVLVSALESICPALRAKNRRMS